MLRRTVAVVSALAAAVAAALVVSDRGGAAPALLSCSGLVPGSYVPGPSTTGIRAGSKLTPWPGDLVPVAGRVYENLDIQGRVDVRVPNVTIRNSRVRGGTSAAEGAGLITATHRSVRNLVVEGVLLAPDVPSYWWNGIIGHDYTARCVNVFQTTDGFGVYNTSDPGGPTRVLIEQSFVHELGYYRPSPTNRDGQTHNDCIQLQGGSGTVIRYNLLHAYHSNKVGTLNPDRRAQAMSAIMFNDNVGKTTRVQVYGNTINGGQIAFNGGGLGHAPGDRLGLIHRNRFDRSQFHPEHTIDLDPSVTADTGDGTANQNVFRDTGEPVRVRHNG